MFYLSALSTNVVEWVEIGHLVSQDTAKYVKINKK